MRWHSKKVFSERAIRLSARIDHLQQHQVLLSRHFSAQECSELIFLHWCHLRVDHISSHTVLLQHYTSDRNIRTTFDSLNCDAFGSLDDRARYQHTLPGVFSETIAI